MNYISKKLPIYTLLIGLLLSSIAPIYSQIPILMSDSQLNSYAQACIESMYAWDFETAKEKHQMIKELSPQHPMVPFLEATIAYWEKAPFAFEGEDKEQQIKLFEQTETYANQLIEAQKDSKTEALFFVWLAKSTLMRFYADDNQYMKAVGEMKKVYNITQDGFDYKDDFVEFYFTSGIYNYYRVAYPEKYPVYKTFAFFFASGDKIKGIEELDYAADHATFTRAEALTYLYYIYVGYEKNMEKAIEYAHKNVKRYPNNHIYLINYIESLMINKRFEEAKTYIHQLAENAPQRDFYKVAIYAFQGMIAQLHDKEDNIAKELYEKAEAIQSEIEHFGFRFPTYIYGGLAKYYQQIGEKDKVRKYTKMAKETDDIDYLKNMLEM